MARKRGGCVAVPGLVTDQALALDPSPEKAVLEAMT